MDRLVSDFLNKAHKKKKKTRKVAAKKETKGAEAKKRNTKAFTFSGGRRAVHRRVQHASEVEEKRLRRPRIFKTPQEPPPLVVVVQGPKSVGKSTLIASLVKQYSKRNISSVNGPITLVSSKARRITFIECGNEMVEMIDCSKIADVALVMIDASYGFEMETFEFVNMMQVHGFPRVIAVLTHLDAFKDNKTLRRTKKVLKKRFWTEIYDGAKMYYFTGIQYGRYKKMEVLNLARLLASQKQPAISWRTSHPYIITLRHEVLSDSDGCASVSFYGYVYGGKLGVNKKVHVPGAGDFTVEAITNFQDPCQVNPGDRTLKDKNRNIYAPYCDVGSLVLDDDAMYIQLFKTKEHFTEMPEGDKGEVSEAVEMVRTLQKIDRFKPKVPEINILNDSDLLVGDVTEENDHEAEAVESDYSKHSAYLSDSDYPDGTDSSVDLGTDDDEYESEYDSHEDSNLEGEEEDVGGDRFKESNHLELDEYIARRVYIDDSTSDLSFKDFSKVPQDDLDLDFDHERLHLLRERKFLNLADEVKEEEVDEEAQNDPESDKFRRIQEEEQRRLFQETLELDSDGNVGSFVRITLSGIPTSFLQRVKYKLIILGLIQESEHGCGYMQIKLKRHRWFPKILKTNDPLLFSIGWRRFQSLPVYCMEDRNQSRIKMLKYTPEHLHCLANIYGPLAPPNFGFLAIKNWDRISNYRISATGVLVGTNQDYPILKKLKLIGEPYKIMKNTCFVKNMFNSELEVIKCIGAKIQTPSGIRGQIKKAIDKNGAFRATFEDKVLLSDLVILKSWINVETKRFYNLMVDSENFKAIKSISQLKTQQESKPNSKYERKQLVRRPAHHFNEIKIPKPIIEKLPFSSKPKVVEHVKDDVDISLDPTQHEKKVSRMLQKLYTIRKHRLEKRKESVKRHKEERARELEASEEARRAKLKEIKKSKYIKQSKTEEKKRKKLLMD